MRDSRERAIAGLIAGLIGVDERAKPLVCDRIRYRHVGKTAITAKIGATADPRTS
jgi:hypothetical protein